jgi:hypothetical protein
MSRDLVVSFVSVMGDERRASFLELSRRKLS